MYRQLAAKMSCVLVLSLEGRASHLASLVQEAEHRIAELAAQVTGEEPEEREESNRERQLKTWEWKLRLYKRMQTGYTHASVFKHTHIYTHISLLQCIA